MSAEVLQFRPFQSARDQAKRAGVPVRHAVEMVRDEQLRGRDGNNVAGVLRAIAWAGHGDTTQPPSAA